MRTFEAERFQRLGFKAFTSAAIRQCAGIVSALHCSSGPIPDSPANAARQNSSTPIPIGDTIPRPVITATGCSATDALLFRASLSDVGLPPGVFSGFLPPGVGTPVNIAPGYAT